MKQRRQRSSRSTGTASQITRRADLKPAKPPTDAALLRSAKAAAARRGLTETSTLRQQRAARDAQP